MFVTDFQISQGVLVVDTMSLSTADVPASAFSASTKIEFFPAIYAPDLPSQSQLSAIFQQNIVLTTQVVNPGDVDFPKPPK